MNKRMINADCLIQYFTYLSAYNKSLTFKQIIDIIEEEVKIEGSEWTLAEEETPEVGTEVFATDRSGFIRHCVWNPPYGYFTFEDGRPVDVVAWMPVIKAYGKGNENEG